MLSTLPVGNFKSMLPVKLITGNCQGTRSLLYNRILRIYRDPPHPYPAYSTLLGGNKSTMAKA